MSEKLTSEGKCYFCDKTLSQRGINRHLDTHLSKLEGKKGISYLVYVKADIMFLCLWVDGNALFQDIDYFLRGIWLECCGHLSAFRDKKGFYKHPKTQDDFWLDPSPEEVPMNMKVSKVLEKGKKLDYEYDFGSTTYLSIEVKYTYPIKANAPVVLLSRNEPLKLLCNQCNKRPATDICTMHLWQGKGFFCEDCAEIHEEECEDFAEYAALPLVNSPRMGVCAYDGGRIDVERDGTYQLQ